MENTYESIMQYMAGFDKFKENPDLLKVAERLLKGTIVDGQIQRDILKRNVSRFMGADETPGSLPEEAYIFKHRKGAEKRAGIGELISRVRINKSISKQVFVLIVELEKCDRNLVKKACENL
jgi:hypothetical protein